MAQDVLLLLLLMVCENTYITYNGHFKALPVGVASLSPPPLDPSIYIENVALNSG